MRVPTLLLADGEGVEEFEEEEDEFEWVTDTDEDDPEFECDCCGMVIEESSDRFHCETCGDYDLVKNLRTACTHTHVFV